MQRDEFEVVLADSLEKILPTARPRLFTADVPLVGFQGEIASFQIGVRWTPQRDDAGPRPVHVEVAADPDIAVRVSSVELVPVELPARRSADDHYLSTSPGLFPDLLIPRTGTALIPVVDQWRSIWVDLHIAPDAVGRTVTLPVTVRAGEDVLAELTVPVHVVGMPLAELGIPQSHWFHGDGVADYYGLQVYSQEYWDTAETFLATARQISTNTVLTPVWTPPLDTGVGHYRTSTQLLGITQDSEGRYHFDFTALRRWMDLCRGLGFTHLEIAHLFTQWGAKATPAIYVETAEGTERRFGWDVPATDPTYRAFLEQLIPQLRAELDEQWGLDSVIFHISDEPTAQDMETYHAARDVVLDLLAGCTVIDAISDVRLVEQGLVPEPVVATDRATPFHDAGLTPWLYFCVAQDRDVANRFIALPSARNRVIGAQLHKFRSRGFLHWGFNFYNSAHSLWRVNPFTDTSARGGFPGGDPFLVYPGAGGRPLESIRFRVFAEAMNDLRAMQMLSARRGPEFVDAIIDPAGTLALDSFSYDADHYRRVFAALAAALAEAAPPVG